MCACACVCRIVVLPCHKCLARPSSASTRTSCWGNLCAQIESTVAKDSAKGCKGQGTLYLYYFNLFHIKGCCEVQSPFQFDFQFKGCANCIGLGVCFLPSSCPMNGMGWNTPVRRTVTLSNSHSFEIQDRSWMNHIQTGLLSKSPSLLGFGPPVQTVFAHPFIDWAWLGHLCHLMNTANMSIGRRHISHLYKWFIVVLQLSAPPVAPWHFFHKDAAKSFCTPKACAASETAGWWQLHFLEQQMQKQTSPLAKYTGIWRGNANVTTLTLGGASSHEAIGKSGRILKIQTPNSK